MAFWSSGDAAPVQSHKFKVEWFSNLGAAESKFVLPHTVKSCTKPQVEITSGEYQVGNQVFKYPGIHKWGDVTLVYVDDKSTTRRLIRMLIDHNWINPVDVNQDIMDGSRYQTPELHPQGRSEGIMKFMEGSQGREVRELHITQHAVLSKIIPAEGTGRESSFWRPGTNPIMQVHHSGDGRRKRPDPGTEDGGDQQGGRFGPTSYRPPGDADGGIDFLERWELKNCWIKSINFGQLDYSSDELINIEITVSFDYCSISYGYNIARTQ